jgi:hypothetical protein
LEGGNLADKVLESALHDRRTDRQTCETVKKLRSFGIGQTIKEQVIKLLLREADRGRSVKMLSEVRALNEGGAAAVLKCGGAVPSRRGSHVGSTNPQQIHNCIKIQFTQPSYVGSVLGLRIGGDSLQI